MKKYIFLIFSAIIVMFGCKKGNGIIDGGLSNPKVNMTTYDFLKSHNKKVFDTTLMVIDKAGMKDMINGDVTFFVPNNYSINNFLNIKRAELREIDENNNYTLDSLFKYFTPKMLRDSLGIYVFQGKISYPQLTENGKIYHPVVSAKENFLISYTKTPGFTVDGIITTEARLVYFVKVLGEVDIIVDGKTQDPSGDEALLDRAAVCQTSGIETTNGIVHVLQNFHPWTFKIKDN
ncbi:hypothetical protein EZ449_07245 [Pedobacter frigidisoli]|uniref:FAS1 domain-containing protein n=1 Tax=Pedobacter frigidisoli TaxID=2530455 RepID=A0A4R0P4J0_9SPHI|nr:fasciclin domain-containing protein [Pedobacter frigidisoli]TCD10679.1 hypothetical protein EZ449_07245 [Pedobacter frigidisoli]